MNLLVTNTRNAQAYFIIRALRPHAEKIVVTMYGKNKLVARLPHAACSRLVDKRYHVRSPVDDWRAGRIQKENTPREEAYVQAVLNICEQEKIDTIFPSFDPHVYVFSKNKERFEKVGILIPVPDYEVVIMLLDKYRTIKTAEEVGFPCPKTYLPESEKDLKRIADELGFPLVIKPRVSSAGRGMATVNDLPGLLEKTRNVTENQGTPMIQEYIPGKDMQSFRLILDKKGELKFTCQQRRIRGVSRLFLQLPVANETTGPHPYAPHGARLMQKLGWWGGAGVQMKLDSRDGIPKLMEINPRLGIGFWQRTELGINEPLMCIKIARGEEIGTIKDYPVGILMLDPITDIVTLGFRLLDLVIYRFRIGVQGKIPVDPSNPPMSLRELFRSYKQTYLTRKKKVFIPYFRYFFQDPIVSTIYWFQFFISVLRSRNQLGR